MRKILLLIVLFGISFRLISGEVPKQKRNAFHINLSITPRDTVKQLHQHNFFKSLHHFYKANLSDQLSSKCEFEPSCSVFSRQAIQEFGPLKGILLTTDRLNRCNGNAAEEVPQYFYNPVNAKIIDRPVFYRFRQGNSKLSQEVVPFLPGHKKSVWLAGCMSALVPGSGKYYLNAPHQATSSLITNLFLGGAAAELVIKTRNPYLSTASIAWFSTFYFGNIYGTVALAKKQRQDPLREKQLRAEYDKNSPPDEKNITFDVRDLTKQREILFTALFNRQYSTVYALLLNLPDSIKTRDKQLLSAWLITLVEMGRFEQCRSTLLSLSDTCGSDYQSIQRLPTQLSSKSPSRASALSSVLPGLGQVYVGNIKKGIISLFLQSASIALAVIAFRDDLYLAGTVFGLYPWLRFYKGGKLNARTLAQKYNERKTEELKGEYLAYIQQLILQKNY